MSFFDRMLQKADEFESSPNERETLLKAIREENANLGKEEGRGARVLTAVVALTVIVWAGLFLFAFVKGADFLAPTAVVLAMVTGMYLGMYRETHDRHYMVYLILSVVALLAVIVTFVGVTLVS